MSKKNKKYNPLKAQKAAQRKAAIASGLYGKFVQKSVPSGKLYKRSRAKIRGQD